MKCKLENRLHDESPFGVVTSHWTLTPPQEAGMKAVAWDWNFKLVDLGKNAKSKMRDVK